MTQYLKVLGIAMLAMLALAASSASAAQFTASTYPTEATGVTSMGTVTLKTDAGPLACSTHSIALLASPGEALNLGATLKCSYSLGGVKIAMNGCNLTATAPTGGGDLFSATLGLTCPTGQVIVVDLGGENFCQFTIPDQANMGTVDIRDDTIEGDIWVQYTASKMEYTVTYDKLGCPLSGVGTTTGGVLVHDSPERLRATNGATVDVG